jgi:predicted  nucleic acid-binding Zn-ribbon protein
MPLFKGRSSLLEVQNRALIKTAKERAVRIDELERELQSAASQIAQLQRELQAAQERTGKLKRDLRTDIERDLQQASNEVERLRWSASFIPRRHQS